MPQTDCTELPMAKEPRGKGGNTVVLHNIAHVLLEK